VDLVLGGYAALHRPERAWFVELLAKKGEERRFCGYDLKAVLVSVSWRSTSSCGSLVLACVTILVPTVPRKSHQVVTLQ
jgi:hypothetical protein